MNQFNLTAAVQVTRMDDPLTYSWSISSKPAGSSATLSDASAVDPSFTPDETGDYTIELVVNDGSDDSVPD